MHRNVRGNFWKGVLQFEQVDCLIRIENENRAGMYAER